MTRYKLTFTLCKTEEEAQFQTNIINTFSTAYCRKKHPAHYLPYKTADFDGFIVWWYYNTY